ncbi:MAG TPA: M1 family metallopeptidase [Anaerolineales bacterium]|nr:M1 family metallopeptidase [Anaerolineales bacterium]
MKRLCIIIISFSMFFASCSVPPPATASITATAEPDLFNTSWEDRSLFQGGLVPSEQSVLKELPHGSVYHIEFNIAEDIYHISGFEEVRYTNAENVPLDQVQFRLFPNILGGEMTVSNLLVDGQSVTPQLALQNSLLIVPFAAPLTPGQSTVITMDFAITVPRSVELNYGVLAYFDDVLTLAHAYPMIAVYDDEGWNAEIPPQSGDVTYADTSFFLVKITAPKNLKVITAGRVIHSNETGERQTIQVVSGPARDFYLAASPAYEEISQTFGDVTIHSYATAGDKKGSEMALDVAARAIEDFSARYAPFPYTELDIVSTPTLALGIEYPGIIAITSRIYDVDSDYRGAPASIYMESTVAHEVGHQWFYGLVGDDQLDDPWLDESLTQFATLQYYADEYGPGGESGFRNSLEARWDGINRAEIPISLPVAGYSGQEYSAIVYGRGPLFFVALREKIGTEAFDAFLKDYTETLSWSIATPEVLPSLAEKHCACELDDIFNTWVYPSP